MGIKFSDLWHPSGKIGRGVYALVGTLGFAFKHNLDRVVASAGFHRPWTVWNYWAPLRNAGRITGLHGDEARFLGTLLLLALPFIWVGVVMTLKRLRSAGFSTYLVVLFFVPFLNLLFFLTLCLVPERKTDFAPDSRQPSSRWERFLPESAVGSAAFSLLVTVPIALGMMLLGTQVLRSYGWGVFVAVPFAMGFASALIYGARHRRSLAQCIGVACVSTGLLGVSLLALAFEGVICLMMAAPLALVLAAIGATFGYFAQTSRWVAAGRGMALSMLLVFTPGLQWAEQVRASRPEVFVVRSAIEVNAPPEKVWQQVVAFSQIPAPREWIFRAGIAYPIRAEMIGKGAGAERHCVFSTGAFVEPIQIWDEPRLLKFSVRSNPAPMEEWTPYHHIEPPHLHGYLVSEGGQFLLTPLPGGRTRLEGTTWYQHGLWPSEYWRVWSDEIIHRIHMRVLTHIRDRVERQN